jgi:hypothetical protein
MTADEAQSEVRNEEVVEVVKEIKEEVKETEAEEVPFIIVEEPPMFPGGEAALYKFIAEHIIYPEVARENNIQENREENLSPCGSYVLLNFSS